MAKAKSNPDDLPTVTITDEMKSGIYALKTTINQEKAVGDTIAYKAKKHKVGVVAVLSPPELRGYVLLEAYDRDALEKLIKGVPHARGLVAGETALSEVEHFLTPKPAVAGIAEGDIVELVAGPFKGERARVQRIDQAKEEITVELFEAMVPIPVTVRGDNVRVLQKKG
ncbi:MAG: transcription termination/antitermination protein NusG [Thermoplasmata archaeon]|jgi:transcriptional antiterminator NusG|nr:transcription termination/antitermination protein NusG [Thermoplasmata archaeon]